MNNSFSFPMNSWRLHGKSLLPPSKISGTNRSIKHPDNATFLLPPSQAIESQKAELEIASSSNFFKLGLSSEKLSKQLKENGKLSASRKYQASPNICTNYCEADRSDITSCADVNKCSFLPNENIYNREQPAKDLGQFGCIFENQINGHLNTSHFTHQDETFSTAQVKLHQFLSERMVSIQNKDNVLDTRIAKKTSYKVRRRVVYSADQLKLLRYAFQQTNYPDDVSLKYIGNLFNLSYINIKVWFQNERKKKKKLAKFGADQSVGLFNSSSSFDVDRFNSTSGNLISLIENQKKSENDNCQNSLNKRRPLTKTLQPNLNVNQVDLPQTFSNSSSYITADDEKLMEILPKEAASTLEIEHETLVEPVLSDLKEKVINVKNMHLSPIMADSTNSLLDHVKKEIDNKIESDLLNIRDCNDSKDPWIKKIKEVRRRVTYSADQLKLLRYAFQQTKYPDDVSLKYIGNLFNLSYINIKVWFQNERKKKNKISKLGANESVGLFNSSSSLDGDKINSTSGNLIALIENMKKSKNDNCQNSLKKRMHLMRTLQSNLNVVKVDMPQTLANSIPHITTDDEEPMEILPNEAAYPLEIKHETLVEPVLSDVKDYVIDVKNMHLSPIMADSTNSLMDHVKKEIDIKIESDFLDLRDCNDVKDPLIEKIKEEDPWKINEIHPKVKEEVKSESTSDNSERFLEDDRLYIDSVKELSPSYNVKKQKEKMSFTTETIDCSTLNSPQGHVKEDAVTKTEGHEGIGQEISETGEEKLEVFDGLQNLKLPLFTIQYPGDDVSNSSSDKVISVAVIQPNSYGAGLVTLPPSADINLTKRRRQSTHFPYTCDMQVGVCMAKFKTWKHLEDHRRTHLSRGRNRKTHKCYYYSYKLEQACTVTVSKKSTLEKHMIEHHEYE